MADSPVRRNITMRQRYIVTVDTSSRQRLRVGIDGPLAIGEAHPRAGRVVRVEARDDARRPVLELELAADRKARHDTREDVDDLGVERGARAIEDDLPAAIRGHGRL